MPLARREGPTGANFTTLFYDKLAVSFGIGDEVLFQVRAWHGCCDWQAGASCQGQCGAACGASYPIPQRSAAHCHSTPKTAWHMLLQPLAPCRMHQPVL